MDRLRKRWIYSKSWPERTANLKAHNDARIKHGWDPISDTAPPEDVTVEIKEAVIRRLTKGKNRGLVTVTQRIAEQKIGKERDVSYVILDMIKNGEILLYISGSFSRLALPPKKFEPTTCPTVEIEDYPKVTKDKSRLLSQKRNLWARTPIREKRNVALKDYNASRIDMGLSPIVERKLTAGQTARIKNLIVDEVQKRGMVGAYTLIKCLPKTTHCHDYQISLVMIEMLENKELKLWKQGSKYNYISLPNIRTADKTVIADKT